MCLSQRNGIFASRIVYCILIFPFLTTKKSLHTMLQRLKKKRENRNKAVSAHHQKQIDRIQRQCLEVKHETDRTILKLKNVEKETARLEKLVSRYHKAIGGTTALDEKVYKITCEADRYIRALSRNQVLSNYQDNGVRLSVYGRNVRKYAEEYPEHDYHEEIPYTDLLKKMEKAKYVVHNSPGFLFALHERLIFPLAKGTPVLFDATEHQKQMLNELPAIYPSSQVFNEYTTKDIEASIKKLRQSHTWIKRLSSLLI